jgi:hypothetical protein
MPIVQIVVLKNRPLICSPNSVTGWKVVWGYSPLHPARSSTLATSRKRKAPGRSSLAVPVMRSTV